MRLTRRTLLGMAASASAFAGCIGGSDGSGAPPTTTATTTDMPTTTSMDTVTTTTGSGDGSAGPTVQVSSHPELGDILVGPEKMTLYMFDSDTKGGKSSTCSGSCADAWPPLTVDGEPVKGEAVTAQVATFERSSGERQVTAGGWPLYYFQSDEAPGDAKGQGVSDVWWVLAPDGTPMRPAPETSTSTPDYTGGY